MTEWRAEVVKLGKIDKHPNADQLSISTIYGEYPAIFRTGEFQEGDLVAFIPYDSICPDTAQFHFLAKPLKRDKQGSILEGPPPVGQVPEKDRIIKAKNLRGIYSDCLIVAAPKGFKEGDSIIDHFKLKKREYKEEAAERREGGNEAAPKSFSLFKYDLEGYPKYSYVFQNEEILITEKIEGENYAVIYSEDRLWVRSRNFFKKDANDSHWWEIAHRLELEKKIKKYPDLAFWGECYGGVKGWLYDCENINGRKQRKLRIFDIFDIKQKKFLEWSEVEKICQDVGLETVPILFKGIINIQELKDLAEGQSVIGTCVKEGVVIRSIPEGWNEKLGRKIAKLKGKGYKLAKG